MTTTEQAETGEVGWSGGHVQYKGKSMHVEHRVPENSGSQLGVAQRFPWQDPLAFPHQEQRDLLVGQTRGNSTLTSSIGRVDDSIDQQLEARLSRQTAVAGD